MTHPRFADFVLGDGRVLRAHSEFVCVLEGHPCCLHNPSKHALSTAHLHWRDDRGLMERICSHGIGHPDPDDLAYKRRTLGHTYNQYAFGVHGCDGCCRGPEPIVIDGEVVGVRKEIDS